MMHHLMLPHELVSLSFQLFTLSNQVLFGVSRTLTFSTSLQLTHNLSPCLLHQICLSLSEHLSVCEHGYVVISVPSGLTVVGRNFRRTKLQVNVLWIARIHDRDLFEHIV